MIAWIPNKSESLTLQLTITGRDLGSPSRAATNSATVVVSVFRNNNAPVFIQTPYTVTVDKNTIDNSNIFTVSAVDADSRVSHAEPLLDHASHAIQIPSETKSIKYK